MWALFLPALMGALASAVASLAGRAVLALGFGAISYTGLTVGINSIKTNIITASSSLGGDALNLMGYLWVDKCLSIIFSAVVAALSMRLVGGAVKKLVMK